MAKLKKNAEPQKETPVKAETGSKKKFNDALKELTASQLVILTGKSHRTVSAKLMGVQVVRRDKGAVYYHPRKALEAIFESDTDKGVYEDEAQLLKQKLKAETHRAEKARIEVELLRNESLKTDNVERAWIKMFSTFRAKSLSIPTKVSLELVGEKDVHKIERRLREAQEEALNELKEFRLEDYTSETDSESGVSTGSAAETNDKRVGGRRASS